MKKIIYTLLFLLPLSVFASGGEIELDSVDIDLADNASLQRGAKHYVTYCLGCHAVKHLRYQRMATDLAIDEDHVLSDIAPEGTGIYDPMLSAMHPGDSQKWFGVTPPDLSLIARSRGGDWLYSYLKSFYIDESKPLGINNLVFKDVGMPNVLWELQGTQVPVVKTIEGREIITGLTLQQQGTLSAEEFDKMITDLVGFLVYASEPIQLERLRMGKYVLFFLLMFGIIAYLLKKEYWKDIH